MNNSRISQLQLEDLLERVAKPGQYLGNEWGAQNKSFESAQVRLALAFPDIYELGMSNFGLKILYKIVNAREGFMVDRSYAPGHDMEELLRERQIPLWSWESRRPLSEFELVGFSLQYELTYTNVLNMLDLANIPVDSDKRTSIFPLVFGGGPSAINPEPMSRFLDFFIIGDGEESVPECMAIIARFKELSGWFEPGEALSCILRRLLLLRLARSVPGVYVPALYTVRDKDNHATALDGVELEKWILSGDKENFLENSCRSLESAINSLLDADSDSSLLEAFLAEFPGCQSVDATGIPERVHRRVAPLTSDNQPTAGLVPYLSLVHDRDVLEVRRGCDRGCRFCQPGYSFLPVRERSAEELLSLSKESLANSGHEEYSLLSLCVSDYTSLTDAVRELNREHSARRTSLSFPSQRADRMNLDVAEELKVVRKSGITLAPEAGTDRLRAVINKGLNHEQIINAVVSAYQSGWNSVKLYFMCCLPTETDEDLKGIISILHEATLKCREIRKSAPENHNRAMEFTCTISNFVPKPFTPFQWFAQVSRAETRRKHTVLVDELKRLGLKNVTLNTTDVEISLLESVISRGGREMADIIYDAWKLGAKFDAWDEQFKPRIWHEVAESKGTSLEAISCRDREVGSSQPWDVVHIGLHGWWLVKEWDKAMLAAETGNCTENLCHACGVCTELDTHHQLASPDPAVVKRNPFVKELAVHIDNEDSHPSLFFQKPPEKPAIEAVSRIRFSFCKKGDLRFIAHLDTQTLLIRAIRRSGLSMAYSQGFNPSPRLSLASPLPIFYESECEIAEIELAEEIDGEQFIRRVNAQLPPEVQILESVSLAHKPQSSLAAALGSAIYRAELVNSKEDSRSTEGYPISLPELESNIKFIENSNSIMVDLPASKKNKMRRGRKFKAYSAPRQRDIRPGVLRLVLVAAEPPTVEMELAAGSQLHVKPSEVIEILSKDRNLKWRVTRLEQKSSSGVSLLFHDLQSSPAENRSAQTDCEGYTALAQEIDERATGEDSSDPAALSGASA